MQIATSVAAGYRVSVLDTILGDTPRQLFLSEYLGRTFIHLPGAPERFQQLITWSDLNRILETQMFSPATLRIKKAGLDVNPESYLASYTDFRKSGVATSVLAKVVTNELREGATLIINGVQKPSPAVGALADDLEEVLDARININLYATLHESHGFPCHYDTHDVLVLQVQGRKHWQVFDRRAVTPFPHEPFERRERPGVSAPLWSGVLNTGDALYLPRGYWHFAKPIGEPTIHLSVGIVSPTGLDVLNWVVSELSGAALLRRNVPLFGTAAEQAQYVGSLRDAMTRSLSEESFLAKFADHRAIADGTLPRARFGLPWSATEAVLPPADQGTIHLTASHALRAYDVAGADEMIRLYVDGKPEVEFRSVVRPLCLYLMNNAPVRVRSFLDEFTPAFEPSTLRDFLRELAIKGLIVVNVVDQE